MLTVPKVAHFGDRQIGPGAYFQKLVVGRHKLFLTETCVFLVYLVQQFFVVKFNNRVFKKNQKKSENYEKKRRRKEILLLLLFHNLFTKYSHCFSKEHRNCSCQTFLFTFLVLLFARVCCSYVSPHFMIRQWATTSDMT